MSTVVKGRLASRVAKGVALLDRERPGWHEAVDVDRLYMAEDAYAEHLALLTESHE